MNRIPIEERIAYKAVAEGAPQHIELDVEGNVWNVSLQFVFFKTDEEGVTYHNSNSLLDPPLQNYVARLNHIQPTLKMTVPKLTKLLKDSITKGVFREINRNSAMIYLTLNSWLQLKPKTEKSKLVVTTPSRYRRLIKEEQTILNQAVKTAHPMK
jgi:hypothetical protein